MEPLILVGFGLLVVIFTVALLLPTKKKDASKSANKAKKLDPMVGFVMLPQAWWHSIEDTSGRTGSCSFNVIYHVKTRVMYTVSSGYNNCGALTPLLNPDGTPMLYEPDQAEF